MSKSKKIKGKLNRFMLYAQNENLILKSKLEEEVYFSNSRNKNNVCFGENTGDVAIYSMAELNNLYEDALTNYGDDRLKYARNLLLEAAKHGNRKALAKAPQREELAKLRINYPNFSDAVDQIECAAALSEFSLSPCFFLPPLLLLGPPGVGKTAFCQEFSNLVKVPFKRLDVGTMSTSSILNGLSLGWGSGHSGEIFNLLTKSEVANPILMFDEIDKINGHYSTPIEPVLLSLLERESSKSFKDEAMLLNLDCSHINFIATANNLNEISEPLKSRFTIIEISPPSGEESLAVVQNIYKKIVNTNTWGRQFPQSLNLPVLEMLAKHPARKVKSLILNACGTAAIKGRCEIFVEDIPITEKLDKKISIGFL